MLLNSPLRAFSGSFATSRGTGFSPLPNTCLPANVAYSHQIFLRKQVQREVSQDWCPPRIEQRLCREEALPMTHKLPKSGPQKLVDDLTGLSLPTDRELRENWRSLYGAEPPKKIDRSLSSRASVIECRRTRVGRAEVFNPPSADASR
jgi:hypothetical protein